MNRRSLIKAVLIGSFWGIFSWILLALSYYPKIEINSDPDTTKVFLLWVAAFPAALQQKIIFYSPDIAALLFIVVNPITIGIILVSLASYLYTKNKS